MSHPERIDPASAPPGVVAVHVKRYAFAKPSCEGKTVLDAACGVGYGSSYLGEVAASVLGVDIDAPSIEHARSRYAQASVSFAVMDVTALDLPDAAFDVVCSFETIEHVEHPGRAVGEAARVLKPDGAYVVSTPRVATTNHQPENPFHTIELSAIDFSALLRRHFETIEVFGQARTETARHRALRRLDVFGVRRRSAVLRRAGSRLSGSPPTELLDDSDLVFAADLGSGADTLVAVCHKPIRS